MHALGFAIAFSWSAFAQQPITVTSASPTLSADGELKIGLSAKPEKPEGLVLFIDGKAVSTRTRKWTSDTEVSFVIDKPLVRTDAAWKALFSSGGVHVVSLGPAGGPALAGAATVTFEPLRPEVTGWRRQGASAQQCDTAERKSNSCWARLGDTIFVTVVDPSFKVEDKIVMWIDGRPMSGVGGERIDSARAGEMTLSFYWPESLPSLPDSKESWLRILRAPFDKRASVLSVGTLAGPALTTKIDDFYIRRISDRGAWAWGIFFAIAIFSTYRLGRHTNLLREDESWFKEDGTRAYSLAKTQMLAWTFVVAMAYVGVWLVTWNEDVMNPRVLVLLGIAIGTTVLGTVVDNSKKDQAANVLANPPAAPPAVPVAGGAGAAPAQAPNPAVSEARSVLTTPKNEWFLNDLISDRNGPAVARVQMLLFSAILMVIFIAEVMRTLVMPQFSDSLLGLMGISSTGYLALKVPEKKI